MTDAFIVVAAIAAALIVIAMIAWLSMRITNNKSVEDFRNERSDASTINQGSNVP